MNQLDKKCKDSMVAFVKKGDMSYRAIHEHLCAFAKMFCVSYSQASRYLDDVMEELT